MPPTIAEVLYSFQLGGSERLGSLLARQFQLRGYRVVVASMYDESGPIQRELTEHGIPTFGFDYPGRSRIGRWRMRSELSRFFRRENVTAAHLHHGLSSIRAGRAARAGGVKRIVLSEHNSQQLRDLAWYRRATLKSLRYIDSITAVSNDILDFFVQHMGVSPKRIRTISNSVDPRLLEVYRDPTLRRAEGLEGRFVVVFLGRLHPDKDVPTLIRAFSDLVTTHPEAFLIVAGDGEERSKVEALINELALQNHVQLRGAIRDVPKLFRLADAFAMSSKTEGLPMALLEAMSAGVPAVCTSVGGIPEILDDENGVLIPPCDPLALSAALARIAQDGDLASKLGRAARATILGRYSIDSIVDQYLELFELPPRWPATAPNAAPETSF